MRPVLPILLLVTSGCASPVPVTCPGFPMPPPSLVAPTDKPTLLQDWLDLKAEFLRSLKEGIKPSSGQ